MRNYLWSVSLLAALALAGCNAGQQHEAQQNLNAAATSAPVRAVRDLGLAAAIATKLATIDVDAALTVHVHADGGVVTLEGQAKTLADKMRFERAARSFAGVKSVVDLLAIDPHIRGARETFGDAGLTAKIQTSIAAEAGLNVLNISTTAKAGVVTLRGTVPSSSVKETVVSTASHVAGVRRVIDELRIAH